MPAAPLAEPRLRHVFVRGLELQARLGVHAHEKVAPQRIVVHVDLAVRDDGPDIGPDSLPRVVDYEHVVKAARAAVAGGHVLLVETLAETLAALALQDARVLRARVSIEKPDAFPDAAAVGVTVERVQRLQPTAA
ncbi:MAG: dihydroneopterin aldolase [Rubritepida sp.]|jgi:dihydroneopterin aldolase|nr:dihydroneopterin aldolase [Rubritepida sp.]